MSNQGLQCHCGGTTTPTKVTHYVQMPGTLHLLEFDQCAGCGRVCGERLLMIANDDNDRLGSWHARPRERYQVVVSGRTAIEAAGIVAGGLDRAIASAAG